jgi:hypothetical protein
MMMPLARYLGWREAALTPSRWLAQGLSTLFYEALLLLLPMPAAILACSAVATLAALGIDMAKDTLLAGALSVGIGFCLQNVVVRPSPGVICPASSPHCVRRFRSSLARKARQCSLLVR